MGPFRGRPWEDWGANQGGGDPPPPPRRTDPLAADRTAPDARGRPAAPTARVYPGGARRRQQKAGRRPKGRRGGEAAPPPPPSPPAPSLEATGATLHPPWSREDAPPPPEGTATRGGGDAAEPAHRAPQRPQLPAPAGVAAGRQAHMSALEQRADEASGRRTAAHQNGMEAAPPMTLP